MDKQAEERCGPWWPQAWDINQFLTCPVILNGVRATAVVDTGFSRSGVGSEVVRRHALVAGRQSETRAFSGKLISTDYTLPKLQVGASDFDGLAVLGLLLKADERVLAGPFPRDRSGLGAVRLPNQLIVRHVTAGSPAERAGIILGDKIVAINNHQIDDKFPRPAERQGYKVAGTALHLELAGGRHVRLVLEDYF